MDSPWAEKRKRHNLRGGRHRCRSPFFLRGTGVFHGLLYVEQFRRANPQFRLSSEFVVSRVFCCDSICVKFSRFVHRRKAAESCVFSISFWLLLKHAKTQSRRTKSARCGLREVTRFSESDGYVPPGDDRGAEAGRAFATRAGAADGNDAIDDSPTGARRPLA